MCTLPPIISWFKTRPSKNTYILQLRFPFVAVHNALGVMETVGKQVQVVSGLGGPVGPVGPVGGDLHHHHHPHPHAHPPHPHPHPHGHPHGAHGHSLVGATSNPGRGQAQPPVSHNQHVPARSTPVQLHR